MRRQKAKNNNVFTRGKPGGVGGGGTVRTLRKNFCQGAKTLKEITFDVLNQIDHFRKTLISGLPEGLSPGNN